MKATTWIIIVLSILLCLSVMVTVIATQAAVIKVKTLQVKIGEAESKTSEAIARKKLRDGYLQDIKTYSTFKQIDKIKQTIQLWEAVKSTEK